MQYTDHYLSPLGNITLASDGSSLTGLWFNGQKHFGSFLRPEHEKKTLPLFEQTRQWLDDYFRGQVPASLPDLRPEGTPFRLAVWDLLREIPYGQTVTYKELAEELARRNKLASMSAQAVGNAVGHNPISILLPCHRVVGSNGSLTGYAGGLSRKLQLLTLERADLTRLHLPPAVV